MSFKKICKIVRKVVEEDASKSFDIAFDEDLGGACGYASYGLHKVLPKSTLVLGAFEFNDDGFTHSWVEYKNLIIDITATQFGIPSPVYIIKKSGNRAKKYVPIKVGEEALLELTTWDYPDNWQNKLLERLQPKVERLIAEVINE